MRVPPALIWAVAAPLLFALTLSLTSIRPVTLDEVDGAWMDWRDAQSLALWLEELERVR